LIKKRPVNTPLSGFTIFLLDVAASLIFYLFGNTEFCASCPWVFIYFFITGGYRLSRNGFQWFYKVSVKIFFGFTFYISVAEKILHRTIFKRVVAHANQPSARV